MSEGSVVVEGYDADVSDDTSEVSSEGASEAGQTTATAPVATDDTNKGAQVPGDQTDSKAGKPVLTDKGTKLDSNPQSAVHQELANARRVAKQAKEILGNPVLLREYMQKAGWEQGKTDPAEAPLPFSVEKLQEAKDIADALNKLASENSTLKDSYGKELKDLQTALVGLASERRVERVASFLESDTSTIREKYPELNPKSPEYNPELEGDIAALYHELDFDPQTGGYKGQYSLAKVTERVMSAASKASAKASQKAQTTIQDKARGKTVTSDKGSDGSVDESKQSPEATIASRISKFMATK